MPVGEVPEIMSEGFVATAKSASRSADARRSLSLPMLVFGIAGVVVCAAFVSRLFSRGGDEPFSYRHVSGTVLYEDGGVIPAGALTLTFISMTPPHSPRTHPRPGIASVDPKTGEVLIGNMGAFSLERYSGQSGLIKFAFGKRGAAVEDFQGCCNPVSASVLPDGNLVVVEKDPSRVKIYNPHGKFLFAFSDLQALTKGCNRVSVAVDSKGRVYLGVNNAEHFVLQYVPKS